MRKQSPETQLKYVRQDLLSMTKDRNAWKSNAQDTASRLESERAENADLRQRLERAEGRIDAMLGIAKRFGVSE